MYQVDEALCTGCGTCLTVCPVEAICLRDERAQVNRELCTVCGACADACPLGAIFKIHSDVSLPRQPNPVPGKPLCGAAHGDAWENQTGPVGLPRSEAVLPATRQFPAPWATGELVTAPTRASVWRRQVWPAVGAALLWVGRELLPELLTAWREAALKRIAEGAGSHVVLPRESTARRGRLFTRGRPASPVAHHPSLSVIEHQPAQRAQ